MCLNQFHYSPLPSAFLPAYPPPLATDIETHRYRHRQKDRQTDRQSHASTRIRAHSSLLITSHPYTQEELLHVGLSILLSVFSSSSSLLLYRYVNSLLLHLLTPLGSLPTPCPGLINLPAVHSCRCCRRLSPGVIKPGRGFSVWCPAPQDWGDAPPQAAMLLLSPFRSHCSPVTGAIYSSPNSSLAFPVLLQLLFPFPKILILANT